MLLGKLKAMLKVFSFSFGAFQSYAAFVRGSGGHNGEDTYIPMPTTALLAWTVEGLGCAWRGKHCVAFVCWGYRQGGYVRRFRQFLYMWSVLKIKRAALLVLATAYLVTFPHVENMAESLTPRGEHTTNGLVIVQTSVSLVTYLEAKLSLQDHIDLTLSTAKKHEQREKRTSFATD